MRVWGVELGEVRQTDGFTCGPTSAMIAGALLEPAYAAALDTTPAGLALEQRRIHRVGNKVWPDGWVGRPGAWRRDLLAHAPLGVRYSWRLARGQRDALDDVTAAVESGWPVAPLPWGDPRPDPPPRPSLGFPRAFALVLPRKGRLRVRRESSSGNASKRFRTLDCILVIVNNR
jgi:hypothetical protein